MTLISALLGIAADRLLTHLHEYRRYQQFLRYVDWLYERIAGPTWDHVGGVLLILAPVWLLFGLCQLWISDWVYGLAGLLFSVVVFIYCLGPRDLAADADTYTEVCTSSDLELRRRAAGRLLRYEDPPEDQDECTRRVTRAVLVEANDRLFAVLFWFALLGPLGAVMYRSTAILYQQRRGEGGFNDGVSWLYAVLLWVPARMVALGYALSGHFDAAIDGWREAHREHPLGAQGSERVITETGVGALGLDDAANPLPDNRSPVRVAMRMVWRTLFIWMVVLAVMTLGGWAS